MKKFLLRSHSSGESAAFSKMSYFELNITLAKVFFMLKVKLIKFERLRRHFIKMELVEQYSGIFINFFGIEHYLFVCEFVNFFRRTCLSFGSGKSSTGRSLMPFNYPIIIIFFTRISFTNTSAKYFHYVSIILCQLNNNQQEANVDHAKKSGRNFKETIPTGSENSRRQFHPSLCHADQRRQSSGQTAPQYRSLQPVAYINTLVLACALRAEESFECTQFMRVGNCITLICTLQTDRNNCAARGGRVRGADLLAVSTQQRKLKANLVVASTLAWV